MRVLITGGLGFIGAWTARVLLQQGHTVRTFDVHTNHETFDAILAAATTNTNDNAQHVEHVRGDITNAGVVEAAVTGCDAIVHLAAVLIPTARQDPLLGARVNVLGTLHVFEAARKSGIRNIAYASSAAVFGPDDGVHPEPRTHYGAYKLANEGNARAYFHDAGINSVGLRPSTAYGPGREIGVTADPTLAMRAAAEGNPYTIRFTGATGMDYVEDIGKIFARAATETPPGAHVFSLQGQLATMDDVLKAIHEVIPNAEVKAEGAPLMFASELDEKPLDALFPNIHRTPLTEGTRKTIEFYRRNAVAAARD